MPVPPLPSTANRRRWRWTLLLFAGFAGVVLAQRPASRVCSSCLLPDAADCAGPGMTSAVKAPNPTREALPGWTDGPGNRLAPGSAGR